MFGLQVHVLLGVITVAAPPVGVQLGNTADKHAILCYTMVYSAILCYTYSYTYTYTYTCTYTYTYAYTYYLYLYYAIGGGSWREQRGAWVTGSPRCSLRRHIGATQLDPIPSNHI